LLPEFHCPFKNDFAIIEYDRGILKRKKVPLVDYQTFSDLVNEVKNLNGEITGENAKKLAEETHSVILAKNERIPKTKKFKTTFSVLMRFSR